MKLFEINLNKTKKNLNEMEFQLKLGDFSIKS